MFDTLILHQLNKLTECQVGDFPSPQAFHSCQVQRFKSKSIKASTKVSCQFPMPIQALPTDLAIQPCDFPNTTPPIIRTFDFPGKALVEVAELFQGLLKKLWTLYLFACRKRQICVLHSEICSYALSCSEHRFGGSVVCDDVKPVFACVIAKDLDISDIAIPFAVLVKAIPNSMELQLSRLFVPYLEGKTDTPFFKFVTRLKLRRPHLVFRGLFGSTDLSTGSPSVDIRKEPLIARVNTDNHRVKCVTRYPRPMFLGSLKQLRQMRLQAITSEILSIPTVIALFKRQDVSLQVSKIVKHIAQAFGLRMRAYRIFIGAHWRPYRVSCP